ncbi:uncharacterized protein PV07_11210 [Cladophialophora immunda]|uniref:RBR-type E3 ubiquitin transferase n=1 Tax=Cladophialophora immunda TaxID=569365 RepID=A0A0D2BXC5_9EURO|nr:uncharacterized protein PV07_11210 [Cladophialophora immunda]KIW22970.1 hypothetical protein PV07_11210 [Cladophialophora immunda]
MFDSPLLPTIPHASQIMANNGRIQKTEHHTGHSSGQSGTGAVSGNHVSAIPKVILRRTRRAIGLTEHLSAFLAFWRGDSDTLTLFDVEVLEQTTDSSPKMTSQPRQENPVDLDPRPTTNNLQDSRVAVGDAALLKGSPDRNPEHHQETVKKRAIHAHSPQARRRCKLRRTQFSEPGEGEVVVCRACFDRVKVPIFLDCGHCYCRTCLNQLVSAGTANRISWPPKCCYAQLPMDIGSIQQHLDEAVWSRYLSVHEEYSAPNPVYCSNKFCSRYIPSSQTGNKEKFLLCSNCGAETCVECKQGRADHVGAEGDPCKSLEDLMDVRDRTLARSKQWKQCPSCKNLVERIDGCDQIHCSCGGRFCYKCGANTSYPAQCGCVPNVHEIEEVIARRRSSRRLLRSVDSAGPEATSSSNPLAGEKVPLCKLNSEVPRPARHRARVASKAISGISTSDPYMNTSGPRETTRPQPPIYSPSAGIRPSDNEGNNTEARNEPITPPESIYGDSMSILGRSGTESISNPAERNAPRSAAPPMSFSFEQPPWLSASGQNMIPRMHPGSSMPLSFVPFEQPPWLSGPGQNTFPGMHPGTMMPNLIFTSLPEASQTWFTPTLRHSNPSPLPGYESATSRQIYGDLSRRHE